MWTGPLLNTLSFLSFHISQEAMTTTSIKNEMFCCCLACASLGYKLRPVFHCIPILSQQLLEKGQSKNRWSRSSSILLLHKMQYALFSAYRFLLWSIVLVFNLSTKTSQAKTLTRGVHFDFHSQEKTGCFGRFWKASLYTLLEEYVALLHWYIQVSLLSSSKVCDCNSPSSSSSSNASCERGNANKVSKSSADIASLTLMLGFLAKENSLGKRSAKASPD